MTGSNYFGVIAAGLVAVSGGIAAAQPCEPEIYLGADTGVFTGTLTSIAGYGGTLWVGGYFPDFRGEFTYLAGFDTAAEVWRPSIIDNLLPTSSGVPFVQCLLTADIGNGPELIVAGRFGMLNDVPGTTNIAAWNGSTWRPLGGGLDESFRIADMVEWNGKLYVGGIAGVGSSLAGVKALDNGIWRDIPGSPAAAPRVLHIHDDGTGEQLYVGATVANSWGGPNTLFARWNGTVWSAVGNAPNGEGGAYAFETFDDGTGPALYATLSGLTLSGVGVNVIRWDGATWQRVGTAAFSNQPEAAYQLSVFDDGVHGPSLYASGAVPNYSGSARWTGTTWIAEYPIAGSMSSTNPTPSISAATVYNGVLWRAGNFLSPANGLYAIRPCSTPDCPADWDQSGGVDGDDIGAFFTDWTAGNADIDQSGGTDGDDITFFFERWTAGC